MRAFALLTAAVLLTTGAQAAPPAAAGRPSASGEKAFNDFAYHRCMDAEARAASAYRLSARANHVPAHVAAIFSQLAAVSGRRRGATTPVLLGYSSERLGAYSTRNDVLLSSATWEGAFLDDEIAAILAHELAHIELNHGSRRLCELNALVGQHSLALDDAQREVHRRIFAGDSALAVELFKLNHAREYEADARGTVILAAAGYDPAAMASMLRKLGATGSSAPMGTHPDIEERISRVRGAGKQKPAGVGGLE